MVSYSNWVGSSYFQLNELFSLMSWARDVSSSNSRRIFQPEKYTTILSYSCEVEYISWACFSDLVEFLNFQQIWEIYFFPYNLVVHWYVIDVFIKSPPTRLMLAFMCSHSRLTPSSAKNTGKERAEAGFRLFWNYINRLLVDYL